MSKFPKKKKKKKNCIGCGGNSGPRRGMDPRRGRGGKPSPQRGWGRGNIPPSPTRLIAIPKCCTSLPDLYEYAIMHVQLSQRVVFQYLKQFIIIIFFLGIRMIQFSGDCYYRGLQYPN